MTKCSKRNLVLSVATLFVLAMPAAAVAAKIHQEYRPQKDDGTLKTNSKTQTNKASPNLFKSTAQGKHNSRVTH